MMTPGEKAKLRNRIVAIAEYIFNLPHILIALAIFLALLATLDFFDGLGSRWPTLPTGLFYRDKPEVYFGFIGNSLLLLAFTATLLGNRETRRNTSFELRPYMRVAWISKFQENDREGQGIRNTCLALVNNGNGLMRNIKYRAWVDSIKIPVRNHSLITPDPSGTKVVYAKNHLGTELGNRDDNNPDTERANDKLVKAENISIEGTYEDVDGHTFDFSFESDSSQQSWFREMDFQHQRTPIRKIVRWLVKKL